jgi:hypothetical protein
MTRSRQAETQCFEARFMTSRAGFDAPLNTGIMGHAISSLQLLRCQVMGTTGVYIEPSKN